MVANYSVLNYAARQMVCLDEIKVRFLYRLDTNIQ